MKNCGSGGDSKVLIEQRTWASFLVIGAPDCFPSFSFVLTFFSPLCLLAKCVYMRWLSRKTNFWELPLLLCLFVLCYYVVCVAVNQYNHTFYLLQYESIFNQRDTDVPVMYWCFFSIVPNGIILLKMLTRMNYIKHLELRKGFAQTHHLFKSFLSMWQGCCIAGRIEADQHFSGFSSPINTILWERTNKE